MTSEIARELIKLDAQMRSAKSFGRCVATRVVFVATAAKYRAVNRLNAIAEAAGSNSTLSERSLDCVFEEGDITDAVIHDLLVLMDHNSQLQAEIEDQFGTASITFWRDKHSKQLALF